MSYEAKLTASISVRDEDLEEPGLVVSEQAEDLLEGLEEFCEIELTIPQTTVDSTYSTAKVLDLEAIGLKARVIYIKTSVPISVIQPDATFLQGVRSVWCATYGSGQEPDKLKFVNLNATAARVKIIIGSKD